MTKIKTFIFHATKCSKEEHIIDAEELDNEVNDFIKGKKVIDIKTQSIIHDFHNNGGVNGTLFIMTILYEELV